MEVAGHDGERSVAARVAAALERLSNVHRRVVQDAATRHALSPLQVHLIELLAAGEPPAPRGSALSRELGVAQPTVSDAAASLVRKGLLSRVADPGDRRVGALALTVEGRQLARALDTAGDVLTDAVEQLPVHDQQDMLSALLRTIAELVEVGVVDIARTCLTCRFRQQHEDGDRCSLLRLPLPARALRVNCPEHEPVNRSPAAS